ncbi:MAG TPA: fused MFS/spermidine synthase, partial [Terriglobia bacterium]|nr:fused MFS/spermidine synthase [Terriglobia bacterium]
TGSLLALIAYPFLIEPVLGASEQSLYWLAAYILLVASVVFAGAILWRRRAEVLQTPQVSSVPPPGFQTRIYWLLAAFVPSGLMLAVTTHISVNLVAMPLVWTLPLGVYLLTFILAFGRTIRVTSRRVAQLSLPLIVLLCPVVGIRVPVNLSIDVVLISIHLVLLFVGCLLCHTALAEARPDRSHLTGYYVWIAAGGALGGVFAAIAAPVLFTSIFEYPLLLALTLFFRQGSGRTSWAIAGAMACLVLGYALYLPSVLGEKGETVVATRNFFGMKRVIDSGGVRKLLHGDTLHGMENLAAESAGKPLIYYHSDGPLGDVLAMMQNRQNQQVAVVGLGAGSIAAYAGPGRHVTFFEIDPEVEAIARRSFTFLQRCGGDCDVVLSDGRLAIAQAPEGVFDLIVLDAFSSDAIPAHLVSREALGVYLSRLKPDGVLLFHVSSRYLKVRELVSALITTAGLQSLERVERYQGEDPGRSDSMYVVSAKNRDALSDLGSRGTWEVADVSGNIRVWTDDYSSLVDLLQWESELR